MVLTLNTPFANAPHINLTSHFKDNVCLILEASRLFQGFSRDEMDTLLHYAHAYQVPESTEMYTEGEFGNYLTFIIKGKADIIKTAKGPRNKKLATVRAGSSLGEMSLVDNLPSSATAITKEETIVLVLTKENLETMLREHPLFGSRFVMRIAWQLSVRLRQTSGMLIDYL